MRRRRSTVTRRPTAFPAPTRNGCDAHRDRRVRETSPTSPGNDTVPTAATPIKGNVPRHVACSSPMTSMTPAAVPPSTTAAPTSSHTGTTTSRMTARARSVTSRSMFAAPPTRTTTDIPGVIPNTSSTGAIGSPSCRTARCARRAASEVDHRGLQIRQGQERSLSSGCHARPSRERAGQRRGAYCARGDAAVPIAPRMQRRHVRVLASDVERTPSR